MVSPNMPSPCLEMRLFLNIWWDGQWLNHRLIPSRGWQRNALTILLPQMMDLMAYIKEQIGNKAACPRVHIYKPQLHEAKAVDRCVFLGLVEEAFFFSPPEEKSLR